MSTRPPAFVLAASTALWLFGLAIAGALVAADRIIDRLLGGHQ